MSYLGLAFWAFIAYMATVTKKERIGGVDIAVKKYRLFAGLNQFRISALVVIITLSAIIHGSAFFWWLWNYDGWRYYLGLR